MFRKVPGPKDKFRILKLNFKSIKLFFLLVHEIMTVIIGIYIFYFIIGHFVMPIRTLELQLHCIYARYLFYAFDFSNLIKVYLNAS